ncbi:MAG: hypothetical protein IKO32_04920 [Lachnospiraceae bacterium]|nr:hypothetical protein [Lachnospiraceae bacterium]
MKKALIAIVAVFVISMIGIVVTTNVLESKNGIEDGVFTFESIKNSLTVDKNTINEQRKVVKGENPASAFLADIDTTVVEDAEGGENAVSEGTDTQFFHASVLTDKDIRTREKYGLTKENIVKVCEENRSKYCYETMDESLHQLYAEILIATTTRATEVPLCTREPDELDFAYRCVLNDHPEIYTINGYTCVLHSANKVPIKVIYTAKYIMTESEEAAFQKKIDEYVKEYKAGMKADASDYAKVKYTYEYLINNTDYVLDSEYNQNICSVMAYHKSVCLGYAKSMQYLLNEVGVKSTIVEGIAASGEAHAWNMVQIGGAYYYTDVTWGDSSYTNGNSVVKVLSGINYDFQNITTDELEHTHTIDNVVPVPQCVEIADNYYVREGLYFDFINTNALSWVFKNAFERGDDHVTVKCANDTVFQEMKFYLLEEQNIFEYLPEGTETLSYGENPEMHTITFILKSQN